MHFRLMWRSTFSLFFAAIIFFGVLAVLQAQSLETNLTKGNNLSLDHGVNILASTDDGVSFVLKSDQIRPENDNQLVSDGLNQLVQEPGSPEIPYFSTFVAIPPEATIHVDVISEEVVEISDFAIPAAPDLSLSFQNNDLDSPFPAVAQTPVERIPNPAIYEANRLFPNEIYSLSEPMYLRDMRLVKLDLFPVQYNPQKQFLRHVTELRIDIRFEGGQLEALQQAPSKDDVFQSGVADLILNFEAGKAWRSLPVLSGTNQVDGSATETAVSLPLGSDAFKIEIDQDGIYKILGSDLAAAGMDIANTNPISIQMMTRGNHVAYDFIKVGSTPDVVENNDIIHFYAEGVNGSRREKQFLTHNIYWLWADGTPTPIANETNAPNGSTVTQFADSITREDENYFFSTWTNQWDDDPSDNTWNDFPNEADSWYWAKQSAGTQTYLIDLPDPILDGGESASFTAEFLTREYNVNRTYQVDICPNSASTCVQRSWIGHKNVNIEHTVPMTALVDGENQFSVTLSGTSGVVFYLNRITVDYLRNLKAVDDELFFTDEEGGQAMVVQDFSEGNLANMLVWDVSSPDTPIQIVLDEDDQVEQNGRYTYTIGIDSDTTQHYIATTTNNVYTTTDKIIKYTVPASLNPVGGADWIAISHGNFITQANTLASHRGQAAYGGLSTYVVDVEDVINIYGYGLPMPEAINSYLKDSLTWSTIPGYVILIGDGLIAPRQLDCLANCSTWDPTAINYVPTDMQFKDRNQGLVPSDNPLVFLVGDDLLPDMAIGRLTVENENYATAIVDKIIKYEENILARTPGFRRILFLADFTDPQAGYFCQTNKENTGALIPNFFEQIHLCIDDYADPEDFDGDPYLEAIKAETAEGVSIMNYRGHGGVERWGGPTFWDAKMSISDDDLRNTWANNGKPVIILSADCLDGHFAWPGRSGLSERFMDINTLAGAAAHWGSSGVGYDSEHTVLLAGFYKGIFEQDKLALGDATNYAKLYFMNSGNFAESEMYSFNLQGDPAMMTLHATDFFDIYLPSIIK